MREKREDREYIAEKVSAGSGFWRPQYDQMQADLEFATGVQWYGGNLSERNAHRRPTPTIDLTGKYIQWIVNELRQAPIGISIEGEEYTVQINGEEMDGTEVLGDMVRQIVHESDFNECAEAAFETAVSAGVGWLALTTDYAADDGMEQRIRFELVDDPTTVYLDPTSKRIDGADATWGYIIGTMPKDKAEEMYGDGVDGALPFGCDLYGALTQSEETAYTLNFYRKKQTRKRFFYLSNGSKVEQRPNEEELLALSEVGIEVIGDRYEVITEVEVHTYVGQKLVGKTKWPIPHIPLVPVYGDRLYRYSVDDGLRWAGVVRKVRDQQELYNLYKANENELVQLSPISPWLAEARQIAGYEHIWADAHRTPRDTLPYNATAEGGQLLPPPTRNNNVAQTEHVMRSADSIAADIANALGIPPNVFGEMAGAQESGKAILFRQSAGNRSTAQYLNNLSKSIQQAGRILLSLIPIVYDTEREMRLRDADGEVRTFVFNPAEVFADYRRFEVSAHAGPSFETRRREGEALLMEMATMVGPEKNIPILYEIASQSNIPASKKVAQYLWKMIPPELKDEDGEAPDPQAMEALQAQEQTITQLEGQLEQYEQIIRQLQGMVMDNQQKYETELAKTRMQEESDIAQAQIKAQSDLQREIIKQDGESDRQDQEIAAEAVRNITQIATDAAKSGAEVELEIEGKGPEAFVPRVPGPVSFERESKSPEMDAEAGETAEEQE